jgi:tetratricopeptide (TPR) repeat protein
LLATNRLEEAAAAYRRVLAVREHEPAALSGLARVQLARGQLDEARALAQLAVAVAPDQAGAHLALGDVLRAQGARAPAELQYELAARLELAREPAPAPEAGPLSTL